MSELKVSSTMHKKCSRLWMWTLLFVFFLLFAFFSHWAFTWFMGASNRSARSDYTLIFFLLCPFLLCTTVNIQWNEDTTCKYNARLRAIHMIWLTYSMSFQRRLILLRFVNIWPEFWPAQFSFVQFKSFDSSETIRWMGWGLWTFGSIEIGVERNNRKFDSFGRNRVKQILYLCNRVNS